jgi:hypothetical protein
MMAMKRIRFILVTATALVLPLVLAVGVTALWPQSWHGGVIWPHQIDDGERRFGYRWRFVAWHGVALVTWIESPTNGKVRGTEFWDIPLQNRTMGFGINVAPTNVIPPGFTKPYARQGTVCAPLWFLLLLSLVPPARWTIAWRRRAWLAATGHCVHCGYDVHATPGRCPECGRETKSSTAQGAQAAA